MEIQQVQCDMLERTVCCYDGGHSAGDKLTEDTDRSIYFSTHKQIALVKRSPNGVFKTLVNIPYIRLAGWYVLHTK